MAANIGPGDPIGIGAAGTPLQVDAVLPVASVPPASAGVVATVGIPGPAAGSEVGLPVVGASGLPGSGVPGDVVIGSPFLYVLDPLIKPLIAQYPNLIFF